MGFFSTEGALYKFISRLWDMIVLNFIWVIFSLPIVTIGASTVAAYSVALKMVDEEEGYIVRSFIKAFKENLKQGILLGIIAIVASYLVYINYELFNAIESNPIILLFVAILAGIFFLSSLLYAFPLAARYHSSIMQIMRNSRQICMKYFVRTLILILLLAMIILMILWNSTTFMVGLILGPAFCIFTIAAFSKRIFQMIERDQAAG